MKLHARLHLYPPHHCAGAEMMVHEMLKALVARDHQVEVSLSKFCPARKPYAAGGVKVFPKDSSDWQAQATEADVLLTHLDNTSPMVSAAIALKKPLVQVLHNTHPATRMWASCKNDLLVYNSTWMRDELGNDPNAIVVRPPVHRDDYLTEKSDRRYVTLINLQQAKGGVIFAQLAAMFPDIHFLGVHGAYGEQLDPRLPNVEIRPHGQDMREVYADTSVLLMPSSYESYGRVGVEAMCSGTPVIATDTPGLREALGPAGIFMPPESTATDWAQTLTELIDKPGEWEHWSDQARIHSTTLDPTHELAVFCDRVEALTS